MTELLWMPPVDGRTATRASNPNYVAAFEARVKRVGDDEGPWLRLDRTAFYTEGGGQPSDAGRLTWDGGEARVVHVAKRGGVPHRLEGEVPPEGALVRGELDWDLRYGHMRNHTAQHLVSALVWHRWRSITVGNQLGRTGSRIDFDRRFTEDELRELEAAANELIGRDLPLRIGEEERAVVEQRAGDRSLLHLLPESVKRLRIVEILGPEDAEAVDYCPCAGTHVMRTGELGRLEFTGRKSKGGGKDRLSFELRP